MSPRTPAVHRPAEALLTQRISVLVVGCGGTGAALVSQLPYVHQALTAWGHRGGLRVTVMDPDTISPTNCVRQPFAESEVGLHKATVLVQRLNYFWGLDWAADVRTMEADMVTHYDLVIGCVDNRRGRHAIWRATAKESRTAYWLDMGNNQEDGQAVLGQPTNNRNRLAGDARLPTAADLFPELVTLEGPDPAAGMPTCSAEEAITRQAPFINQTLAAHACAMLTRLFRHGLTYHQVHLNLAAGRCSFGRIPAPPEPLAEAPSRPAATRQRRGVVA
ncbi:MAG: ThiF family protein ubiquitin-activating enzyme [Gemmatimonadetes bacterium]|nr:ThiF family protein ubiquitin-activating enzyme [Gemmatimonadota bacterium]